MKSFNRVVLIGNLVHDPVLRGDPDASLCTFSIALNQAKKALGGACPALEAPASNGVKTSEVHYFDVTCFGKVAENLAKYKKKGDPLLIEGRLHQSRWDDAKTGAKRQRVGIVASTVDYLPRGGNQGTGEVPHNVGQVFPDAQPVDEGDIPF